VSGEIETGDIGISLGGDSMEHTKVVLRDLTGKLTFVRSIGWKSRIIQTSAFRMSRTLGKTGWEIRSSQEMKYVRAVARVLEYGRYKPCKSHFTSFRTVQ
jgi:hypothetical protein